MSVVDGLVGRDTLGVPTRFYGHEPPNLFATQIAKYFRNATREAILLQICGAGIVFLPAQVGLVQRSSRTPANYYAAPGVRRADGARRPSVLAETLPVWPSSARWPSVGPWRATSTWSTPSTMRPELVTGN